MRVLISLAVVALAGLASASYSAGGGRSLNFRGLVNGIRGGGGGQYQGYANGPLGCYYSFLDPYLRHQEFTWHEAQYQCRQRGMQLVSLDDYHKDSVVSQLIYQYGVRWSWTSGIRSGYQFIWGNGNPVGIYYSNWSYHGPQPDNAEGDEYCLAVLNNHYQDGVVWHDIGCSHRKSFVCEPYYYH